MWLKLESIFESKGPAKKASLWKRLINHRLNEGGNVQQHVDGFFDIIDKLSELSVQVSNELQSIMLLHSLPDSFENFRCAIKSRDTLPLPEHLKVKILDESATRRQRSQTDDQAIFARKRKQSKRKSTNKAHNKASASKTENSHSGGTFKFRCHRCRQINHKAIDCPEKNERSAKDQESKEKAAIGEDVAFLTSHVNVNSCFAGSAREKDAWCFDSGCTSHLCHDRKKFEKASNTKNLKLNLANYDSTDVKAKDTVKIVAADGGTTKYVYLKDALHVPDLRSNLISVAKITDVGNSVEFFKKKAVIKDNRGTTILVADRKGDLYYLRKSDEESARNITAGTHKSPLIV